MSAPAPPRNHDEYEALAVAWAINALEPADQAVFEAHRGDCDQCALTVIAALEIAAELAYGVPDVAPPPQLRSRVLALASPENLPPAPATSPEGWSHDHDTGRRPAAPEDPTPTYSDDTASDDIDAGPADQSPETRGTGTGDPGHDLNDHDDGTRHTDTGHDGTRHTSTRHDGEDVEDDGGESTGDAGSAVAHRRHAASGAHRQAPRRPASGAGRGATRAPGAPRRRRRLVSALVAAVLIAGSAVTTWEVTRSAPAATSDRVAALSTGGGTIATVVAHQKGADVVTDALPPNIDRGTAYYVWGVPAGGAGTPQVVGMFTVTTTGLHSYPVRLTRPLDGYPVLAISEEKAGSVPTAPSSIIGKGALGSG